MKKTLVSLAAAAMLGLVSVASAAPVYAPFTVSTATVPGFLQTAFGSPFQTTSVATSINGTYDEKVAISATGLVKVAATATFDSITAGPTGSTPIAPATLLGSFWSIYAIFTSTAQVTGPFSFAGLTGKFDLYLDPLVNTNKSTTHGVLTGGLITTAPSAATTSGTADDYLLASSTTMVMSPVSFGNLNPPPSFEFVFDPFSLTSTDQDLVTPGNQSGKSLFISPDPFHMRVFIDGTVLGLTTTANSLQATGGTLNVTFATPEPGSLALLGVALAGLGLAQRRRKAAAQ